MDDKTDRILAVLEGILWAVLIGSLIGFTLTVLRMVGAVS